MQAHTYTVLSHEHGRGHAFSALRLLIAGAVCALVGTAASNSIQILDRSGFGDLPARLSAGPSLDPYDPTPRRITVSGAKLTIPLIGSAEQSQYGQLLTVIELLNISDSDAELSFRLRDSSGNLLEMPFYNAGCPACPAIPLSSDSMTLEAKGAGRLQIVGQNPAKVGWAEFSFEPKAEVAVAAQLWVTAADGTVSFAGIPPTSAYREAFLYLDNTSDFDTSLVFVNLSATSRQELALRFRAADDNSVECEARADLAPFGQAVLNAVESLPCSVGKIGLLSVQGQHGFTGIALVDNWEHDGLFTRQFVQRESGGGNNFGVGDGLPGVPLGAEFWDSGWATEWSAGVGWSGTEDHSVTSINFDDGEYIQLRSGTRYTCNATGGCLVRNGVVTRGTIVGSGGTGGETSSGGSNFGIGDALPGVPAAGQLFPASGWATEWPNVGFSGTEDHSVTYLNFDDGGYIQLRSGTRYTCNATGGCRVRNGVVTRGTIVGSGGTGGETPQGSQNGEQYTPLDSWTVSSGRVHFLFISGGGCITPGTINGVTYTVHASKWQRRATSSGAWADIPGTERSGGVCSHSPTEPGQYRGVAEISIDGKRGRHSTKNVLTYP